MKKNIKLLLVLVLLICLTGCILIENDDNGDGDKPENKVEKVFITIVDDYFEKEFELEVGKIAQVLELTKHGYYSTGYYDQPTGGTKYFDASGKSLSVWAINNPTKFYVQYKPISEFLYDLTKLNDGYSYTYYFRIDVVIDAELNNAIKANTDSKIKLNYSFYGYDTENEKSIKVYFKNVSSYNEGMMYADQIVSKYHGKIFYMDSMYKKYYGETIIDAAEIYAGQKLICFISRGATIGNGEIKEINFKITFEQ